MPHSPSDAHAWPLDGLRANLMDGMDCHLASDHDGREVIVSAPIPAATAHVWLLDRRFQRVEMFAFTTSCWLASAGHPRGISRGGASVVTAWTATR